MAGGQHSSAAQSKSLSTKHCEDVPRGCRRWLHRSCCSVCSHNHGDTGQNPLVSRGVFGFHLDVSNHDESWATLLGDVDRTFIVASLHALVGLDGSHPADRHLGVEFFQRLLRQVTLLITLADLPFGTFKEEAIDECAIFSGSLDLRSVVVQDFVL